MAGPVEEGAPIIPLDRVPLVDSNQLPRDAGIETVPAGLRTCVSRQRTPTRPSWALIVADALVGVVAGSDWRWGWPLPG